MRATAVDAGPGVDPSRQVRPGYPGQVPRVRYAACRARLAAAALVALLPLSLAGCSDPAPRPSAAALTGTGGETASSVPSATPTGTVTVLAASSLTEAFRSLGASFESAHPGTRVVFSFGPSSALASQVREGAPVDVVATASPATMDQVVAAQSGVEPRTFARNTLALAVPASNRAGVRSLADLAKPGVTLAVCQPAVPCGQLATQVLASARVSVTPVTLEPDVKGVLAKVALAEVDAGLVYETDVRAAGDTVVAVPVPGAPSASTAYQIATLDLPPNPTAAAAFVDFVLSPHGQATLSAAGFRGP